MYVNAVSAFAVTFNVDDDGDEPNKSKNYVNLMLNESVCLEMNFKFFRSHPGERQKKLLVKIMSFSRAWQDENEDLCGFCAAWIRRERSG